MSLGWMSMESVSFYSLLLLERVQLRWLPAFRLPEKELAWALAAHPAVDWYLRHKCPELCSWLDGLPRPVGGGDAQALRAAELAVLSRLEDLLVYVLAPEIYDRQPFLNWDSIELTSMADFTGRVVMDVGAGTGRLTFAVAERAQVVYAVEPVERLRLYIRQKAAERGLRNIYSLDGLITALPFADGMAEIVMAGHVFGDEMEAELSELRRVTRPGGMILLCPGSSLTEVAPHRFLVEHGFSWAEFDEPGDGTKRKYWLRVE